MEGGTHIVRNVDGDRHVFGQDRAVHVRVALFTHLVHLVTEDGHCPVVEALLDVVRHLDRGQRRPPDLRVERCEGADVHVKVLDTAELIPVVAPLGVVCSGSVRRLVDDVVPVHVLKGRGGEREEHAALPSESLAKARHGI